MQAIQTKFHGPSNIKGSRISATAAAGRIVIDCEDALSIEQNHIYAANALAVKFKWSGQLVSGQLKDGSFVHVFNS